MSQPSKKVSGSEPLTKKKQGHKTLPCPYVCPAYLLLTLITLGLVSSALGKVSVSAPVEETGDAPPVL